MSSLAIIILTKNEEKHIEAVITNAKQVTDKVLIVDSGSTDRTVELAEKNGVRVVFRAWDNDFSAQRNFALENIDTEWVLYLDADERMNDILVADIKNALKNEKKALYRFERRNSAFGRDFRFGVLGPDAVNRMFPKSLGQWQGKVHESVKSSLPIITLKDRKSVV